MPPVWVRIASYPWSSVVCGLISFYHEFSLGISVTGVTAKNYLVWSETAENDCN